MDVPSVILLRQTETEYAAIVDTDYVPFVTTVLVLEMSNERVSFSRCINVGEGERFMTSRENAVKLAKLILWNEEKRLERERERQLRADPDEQDF